MFDSLQSKNSLPSPALLSAKRNSRWSISGRNISGTALVLISTLLFSCAFLFSTTNRFYSTKNTFDVEKCHVSGIKPPVVNGEFWRQNRELVRSQLLSQIPHKNNSQNAAVLIHGRPESIGNEAGVDFHQDSDFLYMSGILIKSASLLIDLRSGNTTLFLERQSSSQIAFEGKWPGLQNLNAENGIDFVRVKTDLPKVLDQFSEIYSLRTDTSPATLTDPEDYLNDFSTSGPLIDRILLRRALNTARRRKSDREIEMIRYATRIAAGAHRELMSNLSERASEFSLLSLFRHLTFLCGCRIQAYSPIVGVREHAAVLHYQGGQNETASNTEIGEGLLLVDASGSYRGYASDITRTFSTKVPFTAEMRLVYSIVLEANLASISRVRPGISWNQITTVSRDTIIRGLQKAEFLTPNATFNDLIRSGVVGVFMPHGLGHTVGIDVHDVHPSGWVLEPRDVLTIEPGIYFNRPIFDAARDDEFKKEFINWPVVDRYLDMNFGGVRIEDVLLVTDDGHEILSKDAPKSIKEIESIIAGSLAKERRSFW